MHQCLPFPLFGYRQGCVSRLQAHAACAPTGIRAEFRGDLRRAHGADGDGLGWSTLRHGVLECGQQGSDELLGQALGFVLQCSQVGLFGLSARR